LRIRQYSYVAVSSAELSGEDLAQRLGLRPHRVVVAGSTSTQPLRPPEHSWQLVCDEPGLTVDQQLKRLVAELEPARTALVQLRATGDATVNLQVVRYFGDAEGEEEALTTTPEGFVRLPGQHQLLGWHLGQQVLAFMVAVGAELDFDEYG
jgi:hypothetical protein